MPLDRDSASSQHRMTASRVKWCGAPGHAATLREAARARLRLLPLLWERHPLSVIEAMQLGIPVIASDVPGSREIVLDGETGYLVPATSVGSYAARVRGMLFDERLRERRGHAGAIRIKESFSFDEHVRRYVELYDRHLLACFAGPSLAAAADRGGCR
jgi:glycosyltransferase involved in cell wall biosynthesis